MKPNAEAGNAGITIQLQMPVHLGGTPDMSQGWIYPGMAIGGKSKPIYL